MNNPSVNRYLHDKSIDHIDHALGRPIFPLLESHRNYFATSSGTKQAEFSASPNWEKLGQRDDMAYFAVTETGRWALSDYLAKQEQPWKAFVVEFDGYTRIVPAKSRSAARYSYYLEVSDCWSELKFGDFMKRSKVRAA
ncbi:hypothetical protein [Phyllobacterium chamaecytisi]|uniref:hypothetical protein n=1 Tax=Phyllobacterium chamaecytisi TaxID=2876082 RepID=UPI001CCEF6EE|nr:hypothetical protein [Phyllobacterium sp. KW56]MBZ9600689.1 hypothetical protein [Phyllobacterium sp. KW56]